MRGSIELDGGDHVAIRRALEHRVAVREAAPGVVEMRRTRFAAIPDLDTVHELADLDAVCADVLHRRRADRARDRDEVFQAGESLRDGPVHEVVPVLAGFDAHARALGVAFEDRDAARRDREHDAGPVAREQHVAAFAEHEHGPVLERSEAEQLGQRLAPAHVDEQRSARRDVERVAAFERRVLDDRVAGAFGGRVDHALRAGALRARIASTHSPINAGPR